MTHVLPTLPGNPLPLPCIHAAGGGISLSPFLECLDVGGDFVCNSASNNPNSPSNP